MDVRVLAARAFTRLNLHIAVVAIFLLLDLVLGTRLLLAWHRSNSDQTDQYNADMATYSLLQQQAAHLRGLPAAMAHSNVGAERFFESRIAPSNSAALADLGALANKDHVRWTRAGYSPHAGLPGIVEMRIEASVLGQYTDIMHFINDLERDNDHSFFVIRAISLDGAQGGMVSLRLRVDTYLKDDPKGTLLPANTNSGEGR